MDTRREITAYSFLSHISINPEQKNWKNFGQKGFNGATPSGNF